jgi:hypothetical protein
LLAQDHELLGQRPSAVAVEWLVSSFARAARLAIRPSKYQAKPNKGDGDTGNHDDGFGRHRSLLYVDALFGNSPAANLIDVKRRTPKRKYCPIAEEGF